MTDATDVPWVATSMLDPSRQNAFHQSTARDVAVGIALPHTGKDLMILKQFELRLIMDAPLKNRERADCEISNRACVSVLLTPLRPSQNGSITGRFGIGRDWLVEISVLLATC